MEWHVIESMYSLRRSLAKTGSVTAKRSVSSSVTMWCSALLLIGGCAQHGIKGKANRAAAPRMDAPAQLSSATLSHENVSRLLPQHSLVHLEQRGDLDGDGDEDLLVVLASTDLGEREFEPRTLLIFQRNPDGKLEMSAHNERAMLCESCSGMMGEPLQGIEFTSDGFVLRFEGGSRELWSREYHFVYSATASTWLLEEFTSAAFDKLTEASGNSRLTSGLLGPITIEEFNPTELREPEFW